MNRTTAPAPLSTVFHDGYCWRLGGAPAHSRHVHAGETAALSELPAAAEAWLAGHPGRWVVGVLAYEAAALLHHTDCAHAPLTPLAVLHFYEHLPGAAVLPAAAQPFALREPFRHDWARPQYLSAVEKIRAYLRAGDCYQVNLAQRFSSRYDGDSLNAWLRLQADHPAPHASYFDYGEGQIFGVSPERFLAINGREILTEPIKGSRPRGVDRAQDAQLARQLLESNKDRAENLMIVDLLRNDLGQLCRPGSITAAPLFELRQFSNVQHLVSTVRGTLRDDVPPLAALLACFPGGSITGAPKRRAMQIIRELEPVARGFYCGSLFWQSADGRFDSSILIRTLQAHQGEIVCHGGGGIVYDSDPELEYAESIFKVEKLMAALG